MNRVEQNFCRLFDSLIHIFLTVFAGTFFGVFLTFKNAPNLDLFEALNLPLSITFAVSGLCVFIREEIMKDQMKIKPMPSKEVARVGSLIAIVVSTFILIATAGVAAIKGGWTTNIFAAMWDASPATVILCPLFLIGGVINLLNSLYSKEKAEDTDPAAFHGTARFAKSEEIEKLRLQTREALPPGSVVLGPDGTRGVIALPRSLGVQHGIIFGGSGTGKTRGYFLPNCAWSRSTSIVVTDPKSELWVYTSGFHERPVRYAPVEPEASDCFNWIPLCRDPRMAELTARAIMESGSRGEVQFWIDAETAYLAAIFAHASTLPEPTPLTAYRLFTRQRPAALLEQLLNSPSEVAREQGIIFSQTDPKIRGSIVPAVAAKLQFMRDLKIARFTSASFDAPDFGSLRRQPTAVYWCMREQDISRLRPLTSLFFALMLEQIAGEEIAEGSPETPITMMLDEFANVGTIPDFATTHSLARGRGVAIWLGVQSLAQLEARYGRANSQTILTNCATKIALHGLDFHTADYVSRMLGDTTVVVERESRTHGSSFSGSGSSITHSRTEHRRPLMTPDEVMRLGEHEAIVRTSNRHPMRLEKMYYDEAPNPARALALGQPVVGEPAAINEEEFADPL